MIWGAIWLVVVVFREEVRCGIMFLVVPFYPFYYILTRLAQTKGPASMVLTAYGVIAVVAAVGPALERQSRPGDAGNQAAGIAAAIAGTAQPPGPEPNNRAADGFRGPRGNRIPFGPRPRRGAPAVSLPQPGPPAQFLDARERQIEAIHDQNGNIPADADPVARSLIQLKSPEMGKKKDAIHRLERTTPDKRLGEVVARSCPF